MNAIEKRIMNCFGDNEAALVAASYIASRFNEESRLYSDQFALFYCDEIRGAFFDHEYAIELAAELMLDDDGTQIIKPKSKPSPHSIEEIEEFLKNGGLGRNCYQLKKLKNKAGNYQVNRIQSYTDWDTGETTHIERTETPVCILSPSELSQWFENGVLLCRLENYQDYIKDALY